MPIKFEITFRGVSGEKRKINIAMQSYFEIRIPKSKFGPYIQAYRFLGLIFLDKWTKTIFFKEI